MEFTKQLRNEIYSYSLEQLENPGRVFGWFCETLTHFLYTEKQLHGDEIDKILDETKNIFTELYSLRTNEEDDCVFWFKNKQERIEALKKCIEQTKS